MASDRRATRPVFTAQATPKRRLAGAESRPTGRPYVPLNGLRGERKPQGQERNLILTHVAFWRKGDKRGASDYVSTFRSGGRTAISLPCSRRARGWAERATFLRFAGGCAGGRGYVSTFRGDVAAARGKRLLWCLVPGPFRPAVGGTLRGTFQMSTKPAEGTQFCCFSSFIKRRRAQSRGKGNP